MGKDVEVNYTGDELFHLNSDNDLGYDAKISAREDGAFAYYSTSSNWDDHVHVEIDKNGNESYRREEGENHSWDHRQKGYIALALQNLSFEELQIVEFFSDNEYLRKSAKILLNTKTNESDFTKKYVL